MDITVISEHSGQSGGETPVPIPNTEVKPVNVLHCTKMCELSGTVESRYTHLFQFILFLSHTDKVACARLIFTRENISVIILSFASTIVIALFTNISASSVVNDYFKQSKTFNSL